MSERVELQARNDGDRLELLSPAVGLFTGARRAGSVLIAGDVAGHLHTLSRVVELAVPEGVRGVVLSEPPKLYREPVDYGRVLYELGELSGGAAHFAGAAAPERSADGSLVLPAPQTGRFYHRPGPGDEAFVQPGSIVENGTPVGLIEVMKTFTRVVYEPRGSLPARARVVRLIAADYADVEEGAALIEVEPA